MKKSKRFWRWFLCIGLAIWFVVFHGHGGFVHQAFLLIGGFIDGLRPDPVLTVTEWSEQKRILSSKGSAEPGQYRVARTPYLRKIMDAMSARSRVKKGVVKKGSQLGFTEAAFNIAGYYIDQVPCAMMYLMPTVDTMERNVKQRIDPMIEECPSLRNKIGKKRSRDGGNTLGQKDYPGGAWFLVGANSASALASIPIMVALLDEVDRYPQDVDDEGSPISLVERRQMTFPNRKTLLFGTPTIAGESKTEAEFEQTDQQYYHVPCPHCMGLQVLVFEQLRWNPGKYKDVHYECIHCTKEIFNHHKTFMLVEDKSEYIPGYPDEGRARWVASRQDLADTELMGWDLSGMYSPDGWYSWNDMAREWDACENDEPRKKSFINTILGKTYKTKGIAPAWQRLHEKAQDAGNERNLVWPSVAFITAGADVQPDRIEVQIRGWMKGRSSQMIDYRVLDGDTTKPEVWAKMDALIQERWEFEGGKDARGDIGIKLLAIDANYNSDHVHTWARKWGTRRVIPIQGRDSLQMAFTNPKSITKTKLGKNLSKGKVWPVGSSYLKELVYGWFRLEISSEDGVIPPGYCHFLPMDEQFFRGLTAEERVPVRNKRTNAIKYEWVKRYERNEPLDTMVYLTAAAYVLGFDRWNDARWQKELNAGKNVSRNVANVKMPADEETAPEMPQDEPETPAGSKKKKRGGGYWDKWKR